MTAGPKNGFIPYGRQWLDEQDVRAVVEVLHSDFLTQGPAVDRFESAVARYCGAAHAVAVSSGTAALHVAVLAAGLGPGDLLWTVPNTFVASANCARYVGADVDFVDIDAGTLTMDVPALARKLEDVVDRGALLPKVVVPVDFGGLPCDFDAIEGLAKEYGFVVLDDAAHSLGASYKGRRVGNGGLADIATFSFHPVKGITAGEGGMVVTNDEDLARRARLFRSHGITRDESMMRGDPDGPWFYEQIELGYNYRMTDIQAALGTSQLERLDAFVTRRNELAARYKEELGALPLAWQGGRDGCESAYHLFVVKLADGVRSRREVFERLRAARIGVNVHYIPVHLQPYYRALGFSRGDFPEAEAYYDSAITLPLFPAMTDDELDRVVAALRDCVV